MSTRTAAFVFSLVFSGMMAGSLHAGTFVFWNPQDPTKGTTDGVNVSVAYTRDTPSITATNMSGAAFNPPGAANQSSISIDSDAGITWTFDQPVKDVLLYLGFWRGSSSTAKGPPDGLYTFDQTPTIQSGLGTDGSISGNSFVVTSSQSFYSGILSFPGQLTSLQLLAPASQGGFPQNYTLSFNAVPEPASWMLLLGAAGAAGLWKFRRRGSAALVTGQGAGR
jgi:hypothetical protein